MSTSSIHVPVLLTETLQVLVPHKGDVFVDGTVGSGGHASAIAAAVSGDIQMHCFDVDQAALDVAKDTIAATGCVNVRFYHMNARMAPDALKAAGVSHIDKVLLDVGMRSDQLETSGRGFSFLRDEPLLMTLSDTPAEDALTARRIVNDWDEGDIANVLFGYGGERYARRIAAAIIDTRALRSIERTSELVSIIEASVPASYRRGRIHPATKTFQALRIAVNDEYGALTEALSGLWEMVRPGGRLAVISFHSGEDGIAKRFVRERVKAKEAVALTKKPVTATFEEIKKNPRSRSAKLRALERITP